MATFQKAGTCLDAQQSMAKQPIEGCVSNHSRTCRKSVSEKSESQEKLPTFYWLPKLHKRPYKATFRREEALYLVEMKNVLFFASEEHKRYDLWPCQKVTDALIYLLDNIY